MANSFKSLIRTGFGLGIGVMLAQIIFLLVGVAFFIGGLYLVKKDKKNNTTDKSSEYYIGITLMILGVVVGGGLGFGTLLGELDF